MANGDVNNKSKKKDAPSVSGLRRSGRETPSRNLNTRKSERIEKQTSPSPSPVKKKLDKTEKLVGPSPLRRSDRGKKSIEVPDLPNIKLKKEKIANNSKPSAGEFNEDKKNEGQDRVDGGRKRKRMTAQLYKGLFKPQRVRVEADDEEDPEGQDKPPQANTSSNEDVDKELKSQNSIGVQQASDKDNKKVFLDEKVTDLDQVEHVGGNLEKQICGNYSPSNINIANNDNQIFLTPSSRINHDLQNQQELDSCDKVTETHKSVGVLTEDAENNTTNVHNCGSISSISSKYVEFWIPIQLSNVQLEQYCATLLSNATLLRSSSKTYTVEALRDILVSNRKCCNHPYIVDPELQNLLMKNHEPTMLLDVGIQASGKLHFLDLILPTVREHQLRVLILFQATSGNLRSSIGEILVDYIHQRFGEDSYEYVVFGIHPSVKQAALNNFNKNNTRFIFILENRACHPSIKLSSIDIIIQFDSDLIPTNDLRALQKVSIGSQLEKINIFRLYSSSTLEEKILKNAEQNVTMDSRVMLRSRYHALLTWGASGLFNKLTGFQSQTGLDISSEESFLKDVADEFLYLISNKCKRKDTEKSMITRVQNCGIYGKNIEIKSRLNDGDQSHLFWRKLLEGRSPIWKFVSESTPRQRKRPNYFLDSSEGTDTVDVRTRRKTANNNTVESAKMKLVIEGETKGVNEDDGFWSTAVINETSLHDLLKPTVSNLCNVLKFSENVKVIVETFLEFVLENYNVSKEHTSALQAFMISLCWIGSSLSKQTIDKKESFTLAKKHFNFSCTEEEANKVFLKLESAKETFLQQTDTHNVLKENEDEPNEFKKEPSRKYREEIKKFNEEWDEKRVNLENDYKVDKALIRTLHSNPSIRSEKLKLLDKEFGDKLEEHEKMRRIHLEDVEGQLAVVRNSPEVGPTLSGISIEALVSEVIGEVPAQHCGDVAGIIDSVELEVDSRLEDAEGGTSGADVSDDVEDCDETGLDDVAVVPHVVSDDIETPAGNCDRENVEDGNICLDTTSHVVEDCREIAPDDVAPHVVSAEIETPAGNCDRENVDDGNICLDMSRDVEDSHEIAPDDVASHVVSDEIETPAGNCDKENVEDGMTCEDGHEIAPDDVAPHVFSAEIGTPAGSCDGENVEDGTTCEDSHEIAPDDVAPHVFSAEIETPAGNCDKENVEDGTTCEDSHEISPDDVAPHVVSAEIEMPAGSCDKENAEDGIICLDTSHAVEDRHETGPDDVALHVISAEPGMPAGICEENVDEDHNETDPNDGAPHVNTADMATPAGIHNEENAEDRIISPDTSHSDDNHNESNSNDVAPHVDSAEMATPAGIHNEENAEDRIVIPDTSHSGDVHNETDLNDVAPHIDSAEIATPAGIEDCITSPDNETSNNNPQCADASQDNTPPVQPFATPTTDQSLPTIPEIQNEFLQQLPPLAEINLDNLQPLDAGQLSQIILEDSSPEDPLDEPLSTNPPVAETRSDAPAPHQKPGHGPNINF